METEGFSHLICATRRVKNTRPQKTVTPPQNAMGIAWARLFKSAMKMSNSVNAVDMLHAKIKTSRFISYSLNVLVSNACSD